VSGAKAFAELVDEASEAREREDRLAREREDARRKAEIKELRLLTSAAEVKRRMLAYIADHAPLLDAPAYQPVARARDSRPKHTWVLVLSDWQMGQKTTLGATGDIFEQTSEITAAQVRKLIDKVEEQVQVEARSKDVEELVILDLGDIIEGDSMRFSQTSKIDRLATVQTVESTDLLNEVVAYGLKRFPKVRYRKVGGNHDRVSAKPGLAGLGELGYVDTFSWLAGAFQERMFSRAIEGGRLDFVNHESFFGTDVIAGQRCVYEHGASFRASVGSYAGISYYGLTNAAGAYERMLGGADLVLMGHFHRPMVLPMNSGWGWHIVNGALPPSTEFVQSNFKSFGRPCQLLLDLHPKYGLVSWKPLYLPTDNMIRPGQFWDRYKEPAPEAA
jgi:hypothetical protein